MPSVSARHSAPCAAVGGNREALDHAPRAPLPCSRPRSTAIFRAARLPSFLADDRGTDAGAAEHLSSIFRSVTASARPIYGLCTASISPASRSRHRPGSEPRRRAANGPNLLWLQRSPASGRRSRSYSDHRGQQRPQEENPLQEVAGPECHLLYFCVQRLCWRCERRAVLTAFNHRRPAAASADAGRPATRRARGDAS